MRTSLKIVFILFFGGSAFSVSTHYYRYKPKLTQVESPVNPAVKITPEEFARLKTRAASIKQYLEANHYNSKICFLADMKMASGKKRFFVYDLQKDSILLSGLVAHGSCDNGFQITANFSNRINSGCSCTGKFRIGSRYEGRFGTAYKLYGLDPTNNNAYVRSIVLHAYDCVPEEEIYPLPVCNSRGCPMVSTWFLQKLQPYIKSSTRPVVINIFN